MKIVKQYFWLLKKIWKSAKGLLCFYMISGIFGMTIPTLVAYSQKLFVASLEKTSPLLFVILFLIVYVTIKFFKSLYQYIDSFFAHKFIFRVNFIFNTFLTKKLYEEPQQSFYTASFNDNLNKVIKGHGIIPFQIFSINEIVALIVVIAFIQIPLITVYSPFFLLLILVDSLFSILTTRKFAKAHYELEQQLTRDQRKSNYFGSLFSEKANAKEIRVFGIQNFFYQKWIGIFKQLNTTRNLFDIRKQKIQIVISLWNFVINSTLLVILFYQLINKSIDFASFIFLYTVVPVTSSQFKTLIQSSLGDVYTNYLNIYHYVEYVDTVSLSNESNKINDYDFQSIELENVSYTYPTGDSCAVKNVSLSIKKGEIVSILGYNGSGKTTLSKLMTGLLPPTQGRVLINGTEINKENYHDISQIFGIAYQDFTRYLLSAKDNIGYGFIEKYSDENIERAFNDANCETLLRKLPKGLNTNLGKNFYSDGVDLSGGEWQKLSLARAYMGNHSVLLLDEPTASIDPIKEMDMLDHFREILKDRTAILISHRIGFARLADKIIMMDKGDIVEIGSHEELIGKDGLYSKLFNAQKELYI